MVEVGWGPPSAAPGSRLGWSFKRDNHFPVPKFGPALLEWRPCQDSGPDGGGLMAHVSHRRVPQPRLGLLLAAFRRPHLDVLFRQERFLRWQFVCPMLYPVLASSATALSEQWPWPQCAGGDSSSPGRVIPGGRVICAKHSRLLDAPSLVAGYHFLPRCAPAVRDLHLFPGRDPRPETQGWDLPLPALPPQCGC